MTIDLAVHSHICRWSISKVKFQHSGEDFLKTSGGAESCTAACLEFDISISFRVQSDDHVCGILKPSLYVIGDWLKGTNS